MLRQGETRVPPRDVTPRTAQQEALEYTAVLAESVCKLHERVEEGDEDAALDLLQLRDELQSLVGEVRSK